MAVQVLTGSKATRIARAAHIAVVVFSSKNCQPCKPHRKALEAVAEKNDEGAVDWFYLDVDECDGDEIADAIKSVPSTRIYVNGEEGASRTGQMGVAELREFVRSKIIK